MFDLLMLATKRKFIIFALIIFVAVIVAGIQIFYQSGPIHPTAKPVVHSATTGFQQTSTVNNSGAKGY